PGVVRTAAVAGRGACGEAGAATVCAPGNTRGAADPERVDARKVRVLLVVPDPRGGVAAIGVLVGESLAAKAVGDADGGRRAVLRGSGAGAHAGRSAAVGGRG